jgi:hypothetical protein
MSKTNDAAANSAYRIFKHADCIHRSVMDRAHESSGIVCAVETRFRNQGLERSEQAYSPDGNQSEVKPAESFADLLERRANGRVGIHTMLAVLDTAITYVATV